MRFPTMAYESVDQLQNLLVEKVFHYAKDAKKAAGRALGTIVEVITFYLLKSWGFEHSVGIERALPEYGNPEIKHNVEYSLHPVLWQSALLLQNPRFPITSDRVIASMSEDQIARVGLSIAPRTLLTTSGLLRNACVIARGGQSHLVATLDSISGQNLQLMVVEQFSKPYAIVECKRVGVEEGDAKGPANDRKG